MLKARALLLNEKPFCSNMDKPVFYFTLGLTNASSVFKCTFGEKKLYKTTKHHHMHTMGIKMSQFKQVKYKKLRSS